MRWGRFRGSPPRQAVKTCFGSWHPMCLSLRWGLWGAAGLEDSLGDEFECLWDLCFKVEVGCLQLWQVLETFDVRGRMVAEGVAGCGEGASDAPEEGTFQEGAEV